MSLYAPPDSSDLKIFVSFSMGKSSAEAAKRVIARYPLAQKIFVSANTSREAEESLQFGKYVDQFLGLNATLVEAVVHHGTRKSSTHRVVTWDTATRDGSVYEEMVKKYGIANMEWLHCTRELKTNPMYSYVDTIWERGTYWVALGIRADEKHRLLKESVAVARKVFYPLAIDGVTKDEVVEEWGPFLNLEERWGNCVDCHKKSDAKHFLNMREKPEVYEFTRRIQKYAHINPKPGLPDRKIFRGNRTVEDMFALAGVVNPDPRHMPRPYEDAGCAEQCEMEVL